MSGSASAAAPDPNRPANAQEPDARPSTGGTGAAAAQSPPPPAATEQAPPATEQAPPPVAEPPPAVDRGAGVQARRPSFDPHADFLITSTDRDAAEARLRKAVGDDLLSLDEFGDRMRAVLDARTRGELRQAVADLPGAAEPVQRPRERAVTRPAREQGFIVAVMSGTETRGRWRPASTTTALAVMGGVVVDLQGAEFDGDELTINALALMGGIEIIVPEGVEVELTGFAIMGGRDLKAHSAVLPDAPLIRVQAYAVMGGVEVRHPKRKDRQYVDDARGAFADRVPLRSTGYQHGEVTRRRRSRTAGAVRRWAAGLLTAAALAVPLGWVLSSDDVAGAVFGGTEHVVATQALEAGDTMTVGAPVAFGSVSIMVPDGVRVERDGLVVFGSTQCTACGTETAVDAPTVRVRTLGGFGSVEIARVGAPGAGLD